MLYSIKGHGAVFMLCGVIIDSAIILGASVYAGSLHSWTGSRLWNAIFEAYYYDGTSLYLGVPFVIGAALLLFGFVILLRELFRREN